MIYRNGRDRRTLRVFVQALRPNAPEPITEGRVVHQSSVTRPDRPIMLRSIAYNTNPLIWLDCNPLTDRRDLNVRCWRFERRSDGPAVIGRWMEVRHVVSGMLEYRVLTAGRSMHGFNPPALRPHRIEQPQTVG